MKKKDHFEQITLLKKKYQFKNYSHKFAGFFDRGFFLGICQIIIVGVTTRKTKTEKNGLDAN